MGLRGPKPLSIETRFWRKVDRRGDDECWPWTAARLPAGYGLMGNEKKWTYAHRLSYQLNKGPIPEGMIVMHSCDNPPCVNPSHLRVGTYRENSLDSVAKGRHKTVDLKGTQHPLCMFGELMVQRLKIVSGGIGYWRLATLLGKQKHVSAIQGVMNGKNWKLLGTKQALAI